MKEPGKNRQKEIMKALEEREAKLPCPRCANRSFTLVDGYFNHFIQQELSGVSIGGPSIPTAVVVCNKCGWLAEHALGVLGLLPKEEMPPKTEASPSLAMAGVDKTARIKATKRKRLASAI